MANDGSVDIIIQKQAIDNIAVANAALEKTLKLILEVNDASRKGASSGGSPNSAEKINKANQASIQRLKLADQTLVMQKKLVQSEINLKNALSQENKEIEKNRFELQRRKAILKDEIKINSSLVGAYEKLTLKLKKLKKDYKDVAASEGLASKNAKRLRLEVQKLDGQLKRVDKSAGDFQRNVGNYPKQMGAAIRGLKALGSALGVVGGLFLAIRIGRDTFDRIRQFDKVMRNLTGILGVTRKELAGLEKEIIKVAGSSIKTSNEVAELAETLITLGKTKEEVVELLKPVNDLSIGLQATSQEAGELLIQTLNAFGKGSDEAQRFADIIAKMRTSTALDFERIKDSLGFVAPTAKALNLTLEETGAMLGILVDNGIKASRAGRLLSSSFARLNSRGIELEDALERIRNSTNKAKTATDLFGVQSFTLGLILADNKKSVADLTKEFENSKGTLKTLTDEQLKSLDAQLKILDSTWEKFILNVDKGDGALSRFTKSTVSIAAGVITMMDEVSTASDGFFSFFVNLRTVMNAGGLISLMGDNIEAAALKERISLTEELTDLLLEQDKAKGITESISKIKIKNELDQLNNDQLRERLKLLKELDKADPDGGGGVGATKKTIDFYKKLISETKALIKSTATSKEEFDKYTKTILEAEAALQALEMRMRGISSLTIPVSGGTPTTINPISSGLSVGTDLQGRRVGGGEEIDREALFAAQKAERDMELSLATDVGFQLVELGNTLFDHKIAAIDEEIRAEEDKYAILFALAEGDAEQTRLLAIQREEDIQKLEKKRREEQKKQAIFNKAQALVDIAINTAIAISKVSPNPVLIALTAALGAAQAATVLATPIPQFAEGGTMGHDGVALVGDGGRKEVIKNPDGSIQVTPSTDTLVNLKKGAEIFPSIDAFNQDGNFDISDKIYSATVMASLSINNDKITSYLETQKVFNDNLLNEMIRNTDAIKKQKLSVRNHSQRIDISDELFKRQYD
jgi:hypothetical protein